MTATKIVNYTDDQIKTMVSDYSGASTVESRDLVVKNLANAFGKKERSIRAKLVSLKVYIKPVKVSGVTGKPAMKKETMAENLGKLMGIFINTESVAKMNKADIQNIGDEVERLQQEINQFQAVADFADFDYVVEAENMAKFYKREAETENSDSTDPVVTS